MCGLFVNNVFLWGVCGIGKSLLVKVVYSYVCEIVLSVKFIEIYREDIGILFNLMFVVCGWSEWFIVFCDDFFFLWLDMSYKLLKVVLEGGIEGCLLNVVFYVIFNWCYLMLCDMMENERLMVINLVEVVDEIVLLFDCFGFWFGFYNCL